MQFEEFYKQTFKSTFRFFYYRGVNFNAVDDLAQEVYLRFYQKYNQKLDDFQESKKIIGGICNIVLQEFFRKEKETRTIELVDAVSENDIFDFYSNPDFETDFGEKQLKLHQIIKSLNQNVRQVLELKYLQNKTRSEISKIMNISQDQVHTYQKRGVKYLKDKLNGDVENTQDEDSKINNSTKEVNVKPLNTSYSGD